jgi:nucleoid-associated protein YgaU
VQSATLRGPRLKRVLFVAALTAAGTALALPFRHAAVHPAGQPLVSTTVVDVPLRRRDIALVAGPPGEVSPATPFDDGSSPPEVCRGGPRPDLESLASPPILPSDYSLAGAGPLTALHRDWKPARLKLPDSRPTFRRHRITDGDTLERLAERYLGNAGRGAEIFAINRDLLTAPDLLPLGKIIRIPAAEQEPPSDPLPGN